MVVLMDKSVFNNDRVDWDNAFYFAFEGRDKVLGIDDVAVVFAYDVESGAYEETNCLAIVQFNDGRWCVIRADCDTTGWECQAGGSVEFFDTLAEATSGLALTVEEQTRLYQYLHNLLVIDSNWLVVNDRQVMNIALSIEADNRYDDMPILADALMDAGADESVCSMFRLRNRWSFNVLIEEAKLQSRINSI